MDSPTPAHYLNLTMHVFLATDCLILRRFTKDDAAHLFALDSDPEVMRYVSRFAPASVEVCRERICNRFLPFYTQYPSYGFWAVVEKVTGDFLGWFHLKPALDYPFHRKAGYQPGDVDLGYRLIRAAWGKGYATEGARVLVRKALTELDALQVVAVALVENVASIRVMEKAGLKRVGEFAIPHHGPAVKYALRREEFVAQLA
jgi:RimJ/RimL family protein N-acetyltransferase